MNKYEVAECVSPAESDPLGGAGHLCCVEMALSSKAPLSEDEDDAALRSKLLGIEDRAVLHDCTIYSWWASHEGSTTQLDRTFATKRQALLYACKRNSDEMANYLAIASKKWDDLFNERHMLNPNGPFDVHAFSELSDEVLQEYASGVAEGFARHKVPRGALLRYIPRKSDEVSVEDLLQLLKRDKPLEEDEEHKKRQRLLLSDIAGFD